MVYSVWQRGSHIYRYYDVPEKHADDTPMPKRRGGSPIGVAPEEISWQLPAGHREVGSGPEAKGVVVHPMPSATGGAALGTLEGVAPSSWIGLVVGGYIISKLLDHWLYGKRMP